MLTKHTYPRHDAIEHDTSGECVCGPRMILDFTDRGDVSRAFIHHALMEPAP